MIHGVGMIVSLCGDGHTERKRAGREPGVSRGVTEEQWPCP